MRPTWRSAGGRQDPDDACGARLSRLRARLERTLPWSGAGRQHARCGDGLAAYELRAQMRLVKLDGTPVRCHVRVEAEEECRFDLRMRARQGSTPQAWRQKAPRGIRAGQATGRFTTQSTTPSRSSVSASSVRQCAGYCHTRRTHSREFNTRQRRARAHDCGVGTSRTVHSTPLRSTTTCGNCSSAAPPLAGNT